ncbi:HPP family protein [Microbulbifer sp. CAU 1566]|uniref:HPP family protein n=1 Tax=Microbulbifer sp. CAU 1566 TaxID=2933269 RepID=UPI00200523B8|nr:HPP family protein [Microbulbifer sp. CAU 1566]MCK7595766.1 HPP family protein [Microbulbifer sp. CAU 1566]
MKGNTLVVYRALRAYLGIEKNSTSHREKLISALGAALAILAVFSATQQALAAELIDISTSYFIIASMGASAVLLFAVPHGALSQPWALAGGHLVSAFVGVLCHQWIGPQLLAAGVAVGLAVAAMYYLRCIHPPGGATALTAVTGGDAVYQLGFDFLLVPILTNVLLILLVAVAFNSLFHWRRYPVHLGRRSKRLPVAEPSGREVEITQEDFAAAIQEQDSFVDITAEGLTELLELAKQHAERNVVHPREIVAGHCYSNGKLGKLWSVRQVVDESREPPPVQDRIIYKVLAGDGSYDTGICLRDDFRQWARFEVALKNGHWVKTGDSVDEEHPA